MILFSVVDKVEENSFVLVIELWINLVTKYLLSQNRVKHFIFCCEEVFDLASQSRQSPVEVSLFVDTNELVLDFFSESSQNLLDDRVGSELLFVINY